jgi:hypothetical protein
MPSDSDSSSGDDEKDRLLRRGAPQRPRVELGSRERHELLQEAARMRGNGLPMQRRGARGGGAGGGAAALLCMLCVWLLVVVVVARFTGLHGVLIDAAGPLLAMFSIPLACLLLFFCIERCCSGE